MQTHMLKWGMMLIGVQIAVGVWGWGPLAFAGAREVKPKAPVPQTGQTECWDASGNLLPSCDNSGQDGDIQAGVAWPIPRFTDPDNGTVRDNLTGLFWLKDGACVIGRPFLWQDALTFANTLGSGLCGLTDGSVAGDWRLPNIKELQSLVDFSQSLPALPAGHPFTNLPFRPWSSTTREGRDCVTCAYAWALDLRDGVNAIFKKTDEPQSVWAVRGGD
jgi:hypothetical protein